ncbi:hypothetical protein KVR01_010065 [Diaporthe batatas]|uniref:uncharacterized protein n=1 Tax=Diaporthe batatas TaxID=748121 RepID=UPI001D04C36D|nr:uncharacterized protein KVR01_010065 [Diaporthe batatas]KAG8160529.1 hypothetical protein KVR01_010065 [Diaporthe batatas]
MAPIDTESQFKFLIACIKHTNAGKVDFGKVAEELAIVSKAAAAKRYERLMKAHGIEKSSGGGANSAGASGGSGPTTPKTPAPAGKTASNRTTPASRKRKMAARSDDVDDDDIKLDVKEEIKLELPNDTHGSYTIDPNEPRPQAPYGAGDDCKNSDELFMVPASRREDSTAPVASTCQMMLPAPTNGFYTFTDPATSQTPLPHNQCAAFDVPTRYECGHADYASQTTAMPPPDGRQWLHHHDHVFFWSDAHLEPHFNIKHD